MSSATSCPWCGSAIAPAQDPCPRCTRSPAQHPSRGASDDALEVDLGIELGSAAPSDPPPGRSSDAPSDFPAQAGGLSFELASERPPAPAGGAAPHPPQPAAAALGAQAPLAIPIVDERVRALAGYAPPPVRLWEALPYAWRVYRQRAVLRERHAGRERLHAEQRRSVREELCALVDEVTSARREELRGLLEPVAQAQALIEARVAELETSSDQHAARVAEQGREIAAREEAVAQCERDRQLAQVAVEEALARRARALEEETRVKQLLERAHDAAREAAGRGAEFAPPEHARRIAESEAEQARAAEVLRQREASLARARDESSARERALREARAAVARAQAARGAAEREALSAREASSASVRQAQEQRLDAYDAVLADLERDHPSIFGPEERARLEARKAALVDLDAELEHHRLAIEAYDKEAFRRGVAQAGAGALVVIALLVLLLRVA